MQGDLCSGKHKSRAFLRGERDFIYCVRPIYLDHGKLHQVFPAATTSGGESPSTPRASGSSATIFAHLPALSLPVTPLWAGHHRISMMIPGLALRSRATCFPAWSAYRWPGPGSSEAIRLMAACASVKFVTRSGIVFLLEADSSARARAAHSALYTSRLWVRLGRSWNSVSL